MKSKFDNNNYDAPKAYCDKHTTGYVKSIGCADCNAKKIEVKTTEDKNAVNNILSTRIFSFDEFQNMALKGTIKSVQRSDSFELLKFGINGHYLFVGRDNPNLLYIKINKDQAMELTIAIP